MTEKITGINVEGRVYEFLSGQGVKGACTAPASSWTKPIVLPEGAVLLDGLIMAITFVNGTNVGFSGTKTVYSSDGENFYYDQAKTDPVTLPPEGNYILEHTSGEEYSFSAFPTITYGNYTLPVRDAKGHITGGEVWSTGDTVICMFMDNMFLMLSAAVSNAVASGDMNPVTSNAVASAITDAIAGKMNVIYKKATTNLSTFQNLLDFIASNRLEFVPDGKSGKANLLILENASGGGCHNVLVGSTNASYFSILVVSYYHQICAYNYTNGTWSRKLFT